MKRLTTILQSAPAGAFGILAIASLLLAAPATAQVRISEVFADPFGTNAGNQVVELRNTGAAPTDIGGWRICVQGAYHTLPNPLVLSAGARYLLHLNRSGTNDPSNYYTGPFVTLADVGDSFALYAASGAFTSSSAIRDFVQWGSGGQPRESVAVGAGIWTGGDFVPVPSEGNSLQLCDTQVRDSDSWWEAAPTLGQTNNCSVTASTSTWGQVKSIYR